MLQALVCVPNISLRVPSIAGSLERKAHLDSPILDVGGVVNSRKSQGGGPEDGG